MSQNLTEKIVQKFAVDLDKSQKVHSGDFVTISPAYVMTHDNTGAVMNKFKSIGADSFANPRQVVHTLDHNIQDTSEANKLKYKNIENFAKEMGNDFYKAGRGIGHQIMIEEGYAWPGTMVVASDSHSNMYGGIGALGTPIVRTDAASVWATGKTWWQIPQVTKVVLNNKLNPGVTGKDLIIALCGHFNNDEVLNNIIEFTGEGVLSLSLDQRLTISNMTTEWGALGGIFPVDRVTIGWLRKRADYVHNRGLSGVPSDKDGLGIHPRVNHGKINQIEKNISDYLPDEDAFYSQVISINLDSIEPYISGPDTLKVMNKASEISAEKVKIDKAYLVSCVNSRVEDLTQAAEILKGKKIDKSVEFYVGAASSEVQKEVEFSGVWQSLIEAGAKILPAGCGPCIGLGTGLLKDGEVGISATNRNFKGRMGSKSAKAYLASPAVVAQSAISGFIDIPFDPVAKDIEATLKVNTKQKVIAKEVEIIDGFPDTLEGNMIFCHVNNMNTDGIYPGKYTYIDHFTNEQQAEVAMENYDAEFQNLVQDGDILVGGYNFGTGSSREQAATALKYRGIKLVIAASFSTTYMRNAINNGFLVIEQAELYNDLKNKFGESKLTIRSDDKIIIDFKNSMIIHGELKYPISPVGTAAQELILLGGLENWVKKNLI